MRAVWRILIVIPAAFIAASIAASIVILLAAGAGANPGEPQGDFIAKLLVIGVVGGMVVGAVAGIPALIAIILAEVFGWRSLILHSCIGAGVGFAAYLARIGNPEPSQAALTVFGRGGCSRGLRLLADRRTECGAASPITGHGLITQA